MGRRSEKRNNCHGLKISLKLESNKYGCKNKVDEIFLQTKAYFRGEFEDTTLSLKFIFINELQYSIIKIELNLI